MIDLILTNGKVWTVNPQQPLAEAVAVENGRIVAVGSNKEINNLKGPSTREIKLSGELVLPGFNDAHVHFVKGGFSLLGVDLRSAANENEFARRLAEYAASIPKGDWITGGDWDHQRWPGGQLPSKEIIDAAVPEHPVLVRRLDQHISVANSAALAIAGISKHTPSPPGGEIVKDHKSGDPTGILLDTAQTLVQKVVPEPTEAQRLKALRVALRHAAELGVTSIHDNASSEDMDLYQSLLAADELTVRVNALTHFDTGMPNPVESLDENWLRNDCIKVLFDGSLGAGSALMFEPYADNPATNGIALLTKEKLREIIAQAASQGLQVAVHAIGDKANAEVLDVLENVRRTSNRFWLPHRIEHAQVVREKDIKRFAELGVIVSLQPSHCIDDMRWVEKRIGGRAGNSYRVRSFIDADIPVAFGTDWPVEPLNPMIGLYAAVTREFTQGGPTGGWLPNERISIKKAVEIYTLGSAYAEYAENRKGTIEPGKVADLVVLDKDILTCPHQEILTTKVLYTIINGKIVYGVDY